MCIRDRYNDHSGDARPGTFHPHLYFHRHCLLKLPINHKQKVKTFS